MTESETELLTRLAVKGTREDLPSVIARIGPRGSGIEAIAALHGILSRATARDSLWIESRRRELFDTWRTVGSPWYAIASHEVASLAPPAIRLASFHPSGRVREASLDALACDSGSDVVSYLLVRANDWVAPIAERALLLARARMGPEHTAAWVAALPCVVHLRAASRHGLTDFLDGVTARTRSPSARAALRDCILSADTETRRACVEIVCGLPPDAAIPLLGESASTDPDMHVAATAAHALLRIARVESLPAVLLSLVRHRVPEVRARALDALWRLAPAEARPPSRIALFDRSSTVRTVAQFELARAGVDVLSAYRDALHDARGVSLATTLSGLSECGSAADASMALAYVDAASAQVRCEALRALARLSPEPHAAVFLGALNDVSTRVVVAACHALASRTHLLEPTTLLPVIDRGGTRAHAAVALSTRANAFISLLACLRAAQNPRFRDRAQARLWAWVHGKRLRIDNATLFERELEAARPSLGPDLPERLVASASRAAR